ncbi:THO complex subunit [Sarcoptes scabiei]|uniref:Uncharacterized protein n=1 Tax=Sarcoptes scabiei TaxID=52283 RepID=A0A132A0L7_SARSC|nr:hypothetical protein QR98_0029420 [Sarcoptes scabiei]UXI21605.1 THO complex subunit [Sarcoptes scabiei]
MNQIQSFKSSQIQPNPDYLLDLSKQLNEIGFIGFLQSFKETKTKTNKTVSITSKIDWFDV